MGAFVATVGGVGGGGCGEAPPSPPSAAGWMALEEAARLTLSVKACASQAKVLCPRGGTIERPGPSAVLVAQTQGQAEGRFILNACDHGQQPVSGTLWVQLHSQQGRVVATHFQGRLRLHGDGGRICQVGSEPAPTDTHPHAHTCEICGERRVVLGPKRLQADNPSGMLGPPGRP